MDRLRRRAYLGLELTLAPSAEAEQEAGLLHVECVDHAGPAARAGVLPGDRIVSLAGAELTSLDQARSAAAALPYAQPAQLALMRDGVPLCLALLPEALALESLPSGHIELDEVWYGACSSRHGRVGWHSLALPATHAAGSPRRSCHVEILRRLCAPRVHARAHMPVLPMRTGHGSEACAVRAARRVEPRSAFGARRCHGRPSAGGMRGPDGPAAVRHRSTTPAEHP
jgi:hypothetical protein